MNIKHTTALLCLWGACLAAASCGGSATVAGDWKLAWEENFNQKETHDTAVWSKIGRGGAPWDKYMSDHQGCYDMRKGNLVLRGIKNPGIDGDTATYVTGGLYSKGRKAFCNGLLEIRAKLNKARGAWPAIWLLPESGNWPHGGEIDIMERLNGDSIAYQTVHSHYTYNLHITENPVSHTTGTIDPDGYNVYAVEMHSDSLAFYINGKHTLTYPRIQTKEQGQFPYDQPFYLLIDMQLGGDWVGPINPDDLPVEMLVDWVRFYRKPGKK